ncbi:hypothetical protein CTAYLR_005823 [Chrysophaeum taylorii]|uniref:Ubiquinol-cytochrome c chaperone domain-containing protein n=1 Tax=Chrysophaeum taylorii TaxID=2483200 RepID=A0AAD7UP05_9STRA|nr:hypothetical protein CTAYLR_005823 [Chrysophaeum taylorii]
MSSSIVEKRFAPLLRVLGYYGAESTRAKTAAQLLRSCAVQAGRPAWAKLVPTNEFRPAHALLVTHVWMLHRRLFSVDQGKLIQEALFDELWDDTVGRIRQTGVAEMMVDKHLTNVQKYSFAAAVEYDKAIAKEDSAAKLEDLGAAVWRHVFLAAEDVRVDPCLEIGAYILDQLAMLENHHQPLDDQNNNIPWGPPPSVLKTKQK